MSAAAARRLLLLRHAESEWNRLGLWQGTADPPLSDVGRRHAADVAPMLGSFGAVWSSGLRRAEETARIIAAQLGIGSVGADDRLAEVHFAGWQGLRVAEIDAGWPGFRASGRRPEGAESDDEVFARAIAGLTDTAAVAPPGPVLVVTHGGLLRTVCARLGRRLEHLPNLGGCWLVSDTGGWTVDGEAGALDSGTEPSTL